MLNKIMLVVVLVICISTAYAQVGVVDKYSGESSKIFNLDVQKFSAADISLARFMADVASETGLRYGMVEIAKKQKETPKLLSLENMPPTGVKLRDIIKILVLRFPEYKFAIQDDYVLIVPKDLVQNNAAWMNVPIDVDINEFLPLEKLVDKILAIAALQDNANVTLPANPTLAQQPYFPPDKKRMYHICDEVGDQYFTRYSCKGKTVVEILSEITAESDCSWTAVLNYDAAELKASEAADLKAVEALGPHPEVYEIIGHPKLDPDVKERITARQNNYDHWQVTVNQRDFCGGTGKVRMSLPSLGIYPAARHVHFFYGKTKIVQHLLAENCTKRDAIKALCDEAGLLCSYYDAGDDMLAVGTFDYENIRLQDAIQRIALAGGKRYDVEIRFRTGVVEVRNRALYPKEAGKIMDKEFPAKLSAFSGTTAESIKYTNDLFKQNNVPISISYLGKNERKFEVDILHDMVESMIYNRLLVNEYLRKLHCDAEVKRIGDRVDVRLYEPEKMTKGTIVMNVIDFPEFVVPSSHND